MIGWILLGAAAVVVVVVGILSVGVDAAWKEDTFWLSLRLGAISIHIPLGNEKRKKSGKGTEIKSKRRRKRVSSQRKKIGEQNGRKLPSAPVLKILAENGYDVVCRLVSRLRVDFLKIHFVAAGKDPYNTALMYGVVGAALEGLQQISVERRLDRVDLLVQADYEGDHPRLDVQICLSLRIFRLLGIVLGFGIRFLRDYRKISRTRERGSKNGWSAA